VTIAISNSEEYFALISSSLSSSNDQIKFITLTIDNKLIVNYTAIKTEGRIS
jgi:hypothetical protein